MSRMPYHEHDHLRALIERMQRDGRPEAAIHEAVRQASGRTHPGRERPARRPGRFGLFGRRVGRRSRSGGA